MKHVIICCMAALFAALPLASNAEDPYVVSVIAPLTGPSASLGKQEALALSVFETTVNKNGGVRGRPIHFDVQDDQSIAQNTVQLMNAAIARKATVVIGSATVTTCSATVPLIENGPVVYCFSPGVHPADGSYMFSASISTADYLIASVRYLRLRGWTKLALVSSNDATGQDAERSIDGIISLPENRGIMSVVDREHFNLTDISTAAQMSRIKASGAQAAILWTVGTPFGTLLRDASQTGLTIPLVASAGNLNYAQLIGYQSFAPDNLYIMAPPWAAPDAFRKNSPVRKAVESYLDAFKAVGIRPDQGQSLAWDPAQMLVDCWRHNGLEASAATIRSYIANQQGFTGVNGAYDFKRYPQRGLGIDWLVMVRWDSAKQSLVGMSGPGGTP